MEIWLKISLLLSCFGFLHEFRPNEPYGIYFFSEFKNISSERVTEEIYPVSTYATLALLIVIFLITDICRLVFFIFFIYSYIFYIAL